MRRRLARDCGSDPAKAGKLGAAVYRAAQSGALIFALCFGATFAFAADLPAAAPIPSPAYLPPVYNWTGFYIGGNMGAGWSGLSAGNFSDTLGSSFTAPTNTQFVGGAQVGANYQFWGGVVIGAEAMFDWLTVSHNNPVTATDPTNTVAVNLGVADARWLSTATGKVGYAWDRVLLYAKGGGAWVATTSPSISVGGVPASFSGVSSTTASTWTAGFGLEWAFSGNWSARAEYDYIALPNQSVRMPALSAQRCRSTSAAFDRRIAAADHRERPVR